MGTDTSHCLVVKATGGWLGFSAHEGWSCKGAKTKQILRLHFHKPTPQALNTQANAPSRSHHLFPLQCDEGPSLGLVFKLSFPPPT